MSQSGLFRGKGRQGAIRTSIAQKQGAVKGESDIAILLPRGGYGSLLIEHKTATGRPSAEQIEYIEYHNSIGNLAVITRGMDAAIAAIQAYMKKPLNREI